MSSKTINTHTRKRCQPTIMVHQTLDLCEVARFNARRNVSKVVRQTAAIIDNLFHATLDVAVILLVRIEETVDDEQTTHLNMPLFVTQIPTKGFTPVFAPAGTDTPGPRC